MLCNKIGHPLTISDFVCTESVLCWFFSPILFRLHLKSQKELLYSCYSDGSALVEFCVGAQGIYSPDIL